MEFFQEKHWSGLPCPPPGDLPDLGIKTASPALADGFFTTEPPGKAFGILIQTDAHGELLSGIPQRKLKSAGFT